MSERKESSSWYIAATHWLTSGFVIPLILTFLIVLILGFIFGESAAEDSSTTIIALASLIYTPLVYWLGVMYSARYVNKKYVIRNSKEIANLATVYLLVVGGGFRLLQILGGGDFTFEHISFLLVLVVFYLASRKYIKNTSDVMATQQPTQV